MDKDKIKVVLAALICSILLMTLLGRMTFSLKAFEFELSFNLNKRGETSINIPPIGSITAGTHLTPIKINLDLLNIDIENLRQLINNAPSPEKLTAEITNDLRSISSQIIFRLVLLAFLGGLLGAILVAGRNSRAALIGAVTGIITSLVFLGVTYKTFDYETLRSPEYKGALKAAPWAIGLAENAFKKFDILGEQMQVITANLYTLFERLDKITPLVEDTNDLLVLKVSDIHNNPAAHRFLQQIVRSFPIDLVIDTGDITDYGTPIEGILLTSIKDLQIPYLFIAGNHDSPTIIQEMAKFPHVQVLAGGIIDVQGLRILAYPDPASISLEITPAHQEAVRTAQERVNLMWEEAAKKPHLAAVHNYNLVENLVGKVPLVLFGHSHQYSIREEKGTVMINCGTTGGAGIRGLQAAKEIPYSVVLLHFDKDKEGEYYLTATDTIKLFNLERGFTLERKHFSENQETTDDLQDTNNDKGIENNEVN